MVKAVAYNLSYSSNYYIEKLSGVLVYFIDKINICVREPFVFLKNK